jgi:hypothetical protein
MQKVKKKNFVGSKRNFFAASALASKAYFAMSPMPETAGRYRQS